MPCEIDDRHALYMLQALDSFIIDHGVRLVIIDSIAALARADLGAASVAERQAALNAQAGRLKYLAETFRMPVLVTNQVILMSVLLTNPK